MEQIYVKFDGGRLTPAPQKVLKTGGVLIEDYNAEANNEMLLEDGYSLINFGDYQKYILGQSTYDDATKTFTDITNTTEYINAQKAIQKAAVALDYKDLFKELDITYSGKVARGATTAAAYTSARAALQSELATKLSEV